MVSKGHPSNLVKHYSLHLTYNVLNLRRSIRHVAFTRSETIFTMSRTTVETTEEQQQVGLPGVVLKLRQPKPASRRRVVWREDTVDNEHMNKKKSKCCCIYEKPKVFAESSSESDGDDCDHCRGHVERRQKPRPEPTQEQVKRQMDEPPTAVTAEASGDRPESRRRVVWAADTIDNENMNKKKSKCCCIYEKPREFGESSSDSDDDECGHCRGHVEKKKKRPPPADDVEM